MSSWARIADRFFIGAAVLGAGMVAGATARLVSEGPMRLPDRRPRALGREEPVERTADAVARAAEPGRGRKADSPWRIPWRGWKDILRRTYEEAGEDRLLAIAAGVVFYSLLALFPAVTALVSSYGLFTPLTAIGDHLSFLSSVLPAEAYAIVSDQIVRIVAKGDTKLGVGFLVGLAIAIWSANAGVKAIIDALNIVYGEKEKRGFFTLNALSLAFTLGALAAAVIAASALVAAPLVFAATGFGGLFETAVTIARWPLLAVGMMFGLSILYRYGPSRREAQWRWLSVGAVAATLLWLVASAGLSFYFSSFANYDAAYGSLAGVMATMFWMWISTIVILFGAELNAEIEHQTAKDTTVGPEKPLGARGATMADTVGSARG